MILEVIGLVKLPYRYECESWEVASDLGLGGGHAHTQTHWRCSVKVMAYFNVSSGVHPKGDPKVSLLNFAFD